MATLSPRDAAAWHRAAGRIAEVTEPRLSSRVLANRITSPGPAWTLEPLGPALRRARRAAARLQPSGSLVLRTDVCAFYPSVTPPALYRALRRLDVPIEDAGTAADLLEGWGGDGYAGLPVGPAASAVLANAVLATADAAIGGAFLRWVDDYLIPLPTEQAGAVALERLDGALARLGLRRSGPKTRLVDGQGSGRWLGMSAGGR